jgi:hypothetical protein
VHAALTQQTAGYGMNPDLLIPMKIRYNPAECRE